MLGDRFSESLIGLSSLVLETGCFDDYRVADETFERLIYSSSLIWIEDEALPRVPKLELRPLMQVLECFPSYRMLMIEVEMNIENAMLYQEAWHLYGRCFKT